MNWISFFSGPVIGAVIGYFTNYIAVKMLFRPRNPVYIGSKPLPFTPGIIPRRKAALGAAIGKAVETELFNGEDVKNILAGDSFKKAVSEGIVSILENTLESDDSVEALLTNTMGELAYEDTVYQVQETVAERIKVNVAQMDLGGVICVKAGEIIPQYIGNPLIAMFITPELMNQFAEPINNELIRYIEGEGANKLEEILEHEITSVTAKTPVELFPQLPGMMTDLEKKIGDIYGNFVETHAEEIASSFKIRETVESRIAMMSNEDLEKLVLSVMKKELNTIVSLGALIGFVLGLFNTLF